MRGARRLGRTSASARGAIVGLTAIGAAQMGTQNGEWPTYGGDTGNTKYAPLAQIDATNFTTLEVAWRFKTDSLGPRPAFQFEGTPLMAKGVVYSTAGSRRAVVALDAATGEQIRMHSEREGARGAAAPRRLSGRGLAYCRTGRASSHATQRRASCPGFCRRLTRSAALVRESSVPTDTV